MIKAEVNHERVSRAHEYVELLRSQGVNNPGESVGMWFNVARYFFGEVGADNHLKETLEELKIEMTKAV